MTIPNRKELPVPYNADAERAVLASLMVDPEAMDRIDALVGAQDFMGPNHPETFMACRNLWRRNEEINEITVAHELKGVVEIAWISSLVTDLPTPIGVEDFARIVRKDARFRRMISVGQAIVVRGYKAGADVDKAIEDCEKNLAGLHDDGAQDFVRLDGEIDGWIEEPGVNDRSTRYARTGLGDLDAILHGISPGALTIIGAQTSVGKSVMLQTIARNALVGQNFRVGVLSLEMSRREWMTRMVAAETGIAIDRLAGGFTMLSDDEQRAVMDARALFDALPIHIDDRPRLTIEGMRAALRKLRAQLDGLDLVLVDYLQLMGGSQNFEKRYLEIGALSRGLKMLARELDIPFVVAAQLSREIDKRAVRRTKTKGNVRTLTVPAKPVLSDLRESGSIEQDADVVLFLYRRDKGPTSVSRKEWDDYYQGDEHPPRYPEGQIEIIVAKQRNGKTGHCYARMTDAYARIEDLSLQAEPTYATPEQFR